MAKNGLSWFSSTSWFFHLEPNILSESCIPRGGMRGHLLDVADDSESTALKIMTLNFRKMETSSKNVILKWHCHYLVNYLSAPKGKYFRFLCSKKLGRWETWITTRGPTAFPHWPREEACCPNRSLEQTENLHGFWGRSALERASWCPSPDSPAGATSSKTDRGRR